MCTDCKELTIPTGAPGTNGANGAPGVKGDTGLTGANGQNGTNAFKFVKQFTTIDIEQTITIPYAQWTACGLIPEGCLADTTVANPYVDVHIQLWLYDASGTPSWTLLRNSAVGTSDSYKAKIIASSGDIVIITDGNLGTYRLIVLG